MTPAQAQQLTQSGIQALRSGQAAQAHAAFSTLAASPLADADAFMGLGYACQQLQDPASALAAVEAALVRDPHHLRGLCLKAQLLAAAGREREAAATLQWLLRVAPPEAELPPALVQELARARALQAQLAQGFARQLAQVLQAPMAQAEAQGGAASTQRFHEAMDLLTGRRALYWPQPRLFHFPGLPVRSFFPREAFDWLPALEAQTAAIRAELQGLLQQPERFFAPYVARDPNRPSDGGGMAGNADWSACYLWKNGEPVAHTLAACPVTAAALAAVPLVRVPGRAPNVLFSLLRPGAHIPPHHGFVNTRLIVHLPLTVPEGCALRVGADTRAWQEGQALLFDDTLEHEAWNRSQAVRVVLLFEVWRPELSATERELVSVVFKALGPAGDDRL